MRHIYYVVRRLWWPIELFLIVITTSTFQHFRMNVSYLIIVVLSNHYLASLVLHDWYVFVLFITEIIRVPFGGKLSLNNFLKFSTHSFLHFASCITSGMWASLFEIKNYVCSNILLLLPSAKVLNRCHIYAREKVSR
jgi:hypothetical protein